MLASINPLGERARNNRWSVTAAWYTLGSVIGGAAFGAALGAVGFAFGVEHVSTRTAAVAIVVAALAALCAEISWRGRRVPGLRRQVNEQWLDVYRSWVYGGGFGAQLGIGVVTVVTTWSVYLVWALALLSGSPLFGALIGGAFGAARALPILSVRSAGDGHTLRTLFRRIHALEAPASSVTLVVEAAVVLGAAGVAWRFG
jgi:sulfite exporter TauE/SafE